MNGRSRLNFDIGSSGGMKSVKHFVPIDIFLAAGIVDGEGKTTNRIVFRAEGDKKFYFLFPQGTEETMKPAAGWLQELLEARVGDPVPDTTPIPEDPVTDLPADPLEA